jgi:hypothetical protein
MPCPTSALPWDESFLQTDFAAFKAQYIANRCGNDLGFPDDTNIVLYGGELIRTGQGVAVPDIYFGPPPLVTPVSEFWVRIDFTVEGGPYDPTPRPHLLTFMGFTSDEFRGSASSLNSHMAPVAELSFEYFTGPGSTVVFAPAMSLVAANNDIISGGTGGPSHFPAPNGGAHVVIMCASVPSAGNMRGELWYDSPHAGSPAVLTWASTVILYDQFLVVLPSPISTSRSVHLNRVQVVADNRASNPFGIL